VFGRRLFCVIVGSRPLEDEVFDSVDAKVFRSRDVCTGRCFWRGIDVSIRGEKRLYLSKCRKELCFLRETPLLGPQRF